MVIFWCPSLSGRIFSGGLSFALQVIRWPPTSPLIVAVKSLATATAQRLTELPVEEALTVGWSVRVACVGGFWGLFEGFIVDHEDKR